MAKKCLVLVADGTEEVEAIAVVDALRRAELEVIIAVVRPEGSEQDDLTVVCSRGVRLVGDVRLTADHKTTYDAVVLPGGLKGAETFRDSPIVIELAKDQLQSGRLLAAICAAPGKMTGSYSVLSQRRTNRAKHWSWRTTTFSGTALQRAIPPSRTSLAGTRVSEWLSMAT